MPNKVILGMMILLVFGLGLVMIAYQSFNTPSLTLWQKPRVASRSEFSSLEDGSIVEMELQGQPISLEVVSSPARITQGLSGRSQIGSDGMLFLLPNSGQPHFWMKEMLFDLDLLWFNQGQVVDITQNVPHPEPETELKKLPRYAPDMTSDMVLEIPAGTAVKWGIILGARLQVK